eukprot:3922244-Rhodomonas_salina.1
MATRVPARPGRHAWTALTVLALMLWLPPRASAAASDGGGALNRLRGGSSAVASPTRSPLKSFVRQTSKTLADAQKDTPQECRGVMLTGEFGGPVVDEEGDSLMGFPMDAKDDRERAAPAPNAEGNNAFDWRFNVKDSDAGAPATELGTACPWGENKAVPFKYVCRHLIAAAAEDEPRLVAQLTKLVSDVWLHSPADLVPL